MGRIARGNPLKVQANSVSGSIQNVWTPFADTIGSYPVMISGVFWSSTVKKSVLRIRDEEGDVWYKYEFTANEPAIDLLVTPLPLFPPFEYLDSEGGNNILVYGHYIDLLTPGEG